MHIHKADKKNKTYIYIYYTGDFNLSFTILINLHKLFTSDKLLLFISELNFNEFGLFLNFA
jgi:hypothetical protein